jgi:hypothetical protein
MRDRDDRRLDERERDRRLGFRLAFDFSRRRAPAPCGAAELVKTFSRANSIRFDSV